MKITLECPVCHTLFERWPSLIRGGTCSQRCGRVQFGQQITGTGNHAFTHGHNRRGYRSPEYRAFHHAKDRCTNPKDSRFYCYGARGIQFKFVSFDQFFDVLGPRPEGKSLDRINNDGHYEPGNVRWATRSEQRRNRRERHK